MPVSDLNVLVDIHNFKFQMSPPSCQGRPVLLALVHSAPQNREKRLQIRKTWGSILQGTLLFVLGEVDSPLLQVQYPRHAIIFYNVPLWKNGNKEEFRLKIWGPHSGVTEDYKVFWDVTLCQWVSGSWCLKVIWAFKIKDTTCPTVEPHLPHYLHLQPEACCYIFTSHLFNSIHSISLVESTGFTGVREWPIPWPAAG
jgi:hypothetical protein